MTPACLSRLLKGATEADVLLFQMGLYYFISPVSDPRLARKWPMPRIHARLEQDIRAFPAMLKKAFPGKIFFSNTGPAAPGKWVKVNKQASEESVCGCMVQITSVRFVKRVVQSCVRSHTAAKLVYFRSNQLKAVTNTLTPLSRLQLRRFNDLAFSVFGPSGAGFTLLDQYAISAPHMNDKMLYNDYVSPCCTSTISAPSAHRT